MFRLGCAVVGLGAVLGLAGCGAKGPAGIILTAAGTGTVGNTGDGGPATQAELGQPNCAAPDGVGHLYIADGQFGVIRKVDLATGVISTYAGTGVQGFSGDGGPAVQAELYGPTSCVTDAQGNLYFADVAYNIVRKVDAATGTIHTVAGIGGGTGSYLGGTYTGDGVPATQTWLNKPAGVALDAAGNLYIGDNMNNRVRRVDAKTGIITTLAGDGKYASTGDGGQGVNAECAGPLRLVVDNAHGYLYWTEGLGIVRRLDLSTGTIQRIAGVTPNGESLPVGDGGAALQASFEFPEGIALTPDGDLLVSDSGHNEVRLIKLSSGGVSRYAGMGDAQYSGDGGAPSKAGLHNPEGLAFDADGTLYIADAYNAVVRKIVFP